MTYCWRLTLGACHSLTRRPRLFSARLPRRFGSWPMSSVNYVRRDGPSTFGSCDSNAHTTVGFFHSQLEGASIPVRPLPSSPEALSLPSQSEIQELAERCGTLEQRIASLIDSYETLKRRELELKEWRWVLREAGGFFDSVRLPYHPGLPVQVLLHR